MLYEVKIKEVMEDETFREKRNGTHDNNCILSRREKKSTLSLLSFLTLKSSCCVRRCLFRFS